MRKQEPIERELTPSASKLYIIFGGIAGRIVMPPFEFYKTTRIINEHKIFIRDFSQCWYHDGLPGISRDIGSTAKFLKDEITGLNPEKVFFVGNSMGGFAAILFANLVGGGEAIAFAPQTFISRFKRLLYGDRRWKKQISNTYRRCANKEKIFDLRDFLTQSDFIPKISIFVSKNDRLDYIHAEQLRVFQNVNIYLFEGGGHNIVKCLRDLGKLPTILSGHFAYEAQQKIAI